MNDFIEIVNANENNLKNISLKIPKNKITIFTGISGSGKSSLVFDTIAQEAGRQLNEIFTAYQRLFLPKYRRPKVDHINNLSTAIVIDQKRIGGNARSTVGTVTEINSLFRILFSRFGEPKHGEGYANEFSFNDPLGMCPICEGIGKTIALNLKASIDMDKSLNEGAILLPNYKIGSYYWKLYAESGLFNPDKPIKDYTDEEMQMFLYGDSIKITIESRGEVFNPTYEGLSNRFMRSNINNDKDTSKTSAKNIEKYTNIVKCPSCKGKRYNDSALESKIKGYSIYDLTNMELERLYEVIDQLSTEESKVIIDRIKESLKNLLDIGLGYLTLTREVTTLSGGESQRVKIVKYLSSSLTNVLYIFDEPSTGLHPMDVYRLNELLIKIRDKGNTVLVVEHDPDLIRIADYIVDIGPLAGKDGGEIVYQGDYEGLLKSNTITGKYLNTKISFKDRLRDINEFYESEESSLHNLKNIKLKIPKGTFTTITGVAGSGKSTLVNYVFREKYENCVFIDQSEVSVNKRSNPATFTGIMDEIRKVFADANSVDAGFFSYNSKGACENCQGSGVIEINLSYMDKSEKECPVCHGSRYKNHVLKYLYNQKNIVDIMDMTISEAVEFFENKKINKVLRNLTDVGLGYLTLGQSLDTVSGGEAQRLKLAKELNNKGNIYILDEPTSGLHSSDIKNIIKIIDSLVDRGNTAIVIEHNTDIMRSSDWIIDLGPLGGNKGGNIIFEGRPKDLFNCKESNTAKYI